MLTVLITTSGIGSRLGEFTQYTNKSLVRLGDKYSICYIIEQYPENTEFVITLGYYGDHVREFIELSYPKRTFYFVDVNNYNKVGSSLVYSMLQAKEYLQKPFVFHCCDTIIQEQIKITNCNTLYVNKHDDYLSYSSVDVDYSSEYIIKMNKKGTKDNSFVYIGLSYIHDFIPFWLSLEKVYSMQPNDSSLSDINVVSDMISNGYLYKYSVVTNFYDTGNIKSYTKAREHFLMKFHTLEKKNESLCFMEDKVIKFIHDAEVNKKRYLRGNDLYPISPKIVGYKRNFILMNFVRGTILSEYYCHGEIYKLLNWSRDNLWTNKTQNEEFKTNCINFYKKKTMTRINALPFLNKEISYVNGLETCSIHKLLDKLDFEYLSTDTFYKFHGDFILDNIMKTEENLFSLLDWRHEFDNQLLLGDMYYDLAKLRHNIYFNHKNITNGLFSVEDTKNGMFVDMKCNYFLIKQIEEFDRYVSENSLDLQKIKILTSLIWLNMSSLYEYPLNTFLFYFGKYNLYLNISHNCLSNE